METVLMAISTFLILQGIFLICLGIAIIKNNHPKERVAEIIKPMIKHKYKPKEPTPDEIKYSKILANIDAYDGSGKGQVKP
jgi:uncharacterized membrane protein